MKRFAPKLALFLLLGAIINVAVAWGCVSVCHLNSTDAWVTKDDIAYWRTRPTLKKVEDITPAARSVSSFGVVQHINTAVWIDYDQASELGSCGHIAAGWPCLAFNGDADDVDRPAWMRNGVLRSPWRPLFRLNHRDGWRDLPFIPIWPGFAINTIFYAAILWLPFAAIGVLRRRRRIKRGLCARCGYPVSASGSAVCSECGTAVHRAAAPCNPCRKLRTAESPQ